MDDKGIPPPDFSSPDQFNVSDDQFLEEESDSFRDLMKSENKEQERVQEDTRSQLKRQEDSLKTLVQNETIKEDTSMLDDEKGIDEEESKKLSEDQDVKENEERRQASLAKGKHGKSVKFEKNNGGGITDNTGSTQGGDDSLKSKKLQVKSEQSSGDPAEDLDHDLQSKQGKLSSKARARSMKQEEAMAQKNPSSADKSKSAKPLKKTEKTKDANSIAANLALGAKPLEASKSQKGSLEPNVSHVDMRKELEGLVKKIIEEAQVLHNGDEVKTTISLDLPDSIFDQGEITLSTFKYRPLEVNLKFQKFNSKGAKLIRQNQDDLKNVLKKNSLKVHQLEIIE